MIHLLVWLLWFASGQTCEGVTGPTIVERREGAFVREHRPAWACRIDGDGRVVLED